MAADARPTRRSAGPCSWWPSGAGLVDLAAQLAALTETARGHACDACGLPLPPLHPTGGFRIDPALVYALTRLESDFDSGAVSPAGARGLMQIMPMTARFMTGNAALGSEKLHDPAFNLALGQRYVAYLAGQDGVDGDLLRCWRATMQRSHAICTHGRDDP